MSRRLTLVVLALVAGLAGFAVPTPSDATYVARTTNSLSQVAASPDWTPPTVTLRNPSTPVKDTVVLTADAADAESGIASVEIQRFVAGSGWTTICTAAAAPYSCSWDTKLAADGAASLRALATDKAGYVTTSAVVDTVVANKLLVTLSDPGDVVKGSVPLTATLYNAGSVSYKVAIEYAPAGTSTWKSACTVSAAAPYTCAWNTTAFTSGDSYDLRAVATAGSTSTYSALDTDVLVDNVAPTVTMTDPGTPLRGTVTLGATAGDNESGVASVQLQWQRNGTSTWTTACTLGTDPFTCRFDTTTLTDGTYSFRAIAIDGADWSTTSAAIGSRVVDNTVSTVSMEDPGAFLLGTVTLAANASSTASVTSVRIDRAPAGTTSWTAVCTDAGAPYSCSWDTTTVANGLYDFRAVLVDGKGVTTTSATVTGRRVDNSALRGYDVQAVNGGVSAGRLDAGDVLRLTYSDVVAPGSLTSGWTGAALAVSVRLRDGMLVGLGAKNDTVDVQRGTGTVALGSVNLRGDYVKNNKSATFNATMTLSTVTVNGTPSSVVTLTLGTLASGGSLRTSSALTTMLWTPSALATDTSGRPSSTAPVTESGTADRDF